MMNRRQFEQTFRNRPAYGPPPLLSRDDAARLLRALARDAGHRAVAAEAWSRVIPRQIALATSAVAFVDGVLEVEVADAVVAHYVRQQTAWLQRSLTLLVPGLRGLRVITTGGSGIADRSEGE